LSRYNAAPQALVAKGLLGANEQNDPAAILEALHALLRDVIDDTQVGNA